jgi:response regulator NasT
VPAVEAAFARGRSLSAPAPAPAAPERSLPSGGALDPIAIAVGVLMHRYSLSRDEALARLHELAITEGQPLAAQAVRLIDAVELLARPGKL